MRQIDAALERYRVARADLDAAIRNGAHESAVDVLLDAAIEAAAAYVEMPAQVPKDLADKIEVLIADGDWEQHAPIVLNDARRLAA